MYGRKTFQMMESYWPTAAENPGASKHDVAHSKWYKRAKKITLSTTLIQADLNNTIVIGDHIAETINEIKREPGNEILLFGSPTATQALINLGLIDGYWLFVNPVILGQGVQLFNGHSEKAALKLASEPVSFSTGVVEMNYLVNR